MEVDNLWHLFSQLEEAYCLLCTFYSSLLNSSDALSPTLRLNGVGNSMRWCLYGTKRSGMQVQNSSLKVLQH